MGRAGAAGYLSLEVTTALGVVVVLGVVVLGVVVVLVHGLDRDGLEARRPVVAMRAAAPAAPGVVTSDPGTFPSDRGTGDGAADEGEGLGRDGGRGAPGWLSGWPAGDGTGARSPATGVWTSEPAAQPSSGGPAAAGTGGGGSSASAGEGVDGGAWAGGAPGDGDQPASGRSGAGVWPLTCTKEIDDLAELRDAMLTSGPEEIICVRGPRTRPAALAAVAFARSQLGAPYRWGGNGRRDGGFDCSGLTSASYGAAGVPLPRTAQAQYDAGPRLSHDQPIQAGDLVFFGSGPHGVGHVGLAISATQMIHAPDLGQVVTIGPIRRRDFVGATRPVAARIVRELGDPPDR